MAGDHLGFREVGGGAGVSGDELALRLGIGRERVDELAATAAIVRGPDGSFDPGDVHRVRLLLAFEAAGVPLEALVRASQMGAISLRYYDQLHPPPGPLSGRTYEAFVASARPVSGHSCSRHSGWPNRTPTAT